MVVVRAAASGMGGRVAWAVVLALVVISIDPPKVLFGGFLLYGLSGPTLFLWRWRRHSRRLTGNP